MQPPVIKQGPHTGVVLQDFDHRLAGRLDADRQAKRFVDVARTVMDGLPWQAHAQKPAVSLDDADPAGDVVEQLVAAAKGHGGNGRAVVLKADPASDDDRCGQDQLQDTEPLVLSPVVVVEKGAPLQVPTGGAAAGGGNKGVAARETPFGPGLGPVLAARLKAGRRAGSR